MNYFWKFGFKSSLSILVFLNLLFYSAPSLLCQELERTDFRLNRQFLKNFKDDFFNISRSPKAWKKKDVFTFSAIAASGILFYTFDREIQEYIIERRSNSSYELSELASTLGNGVFLLALMSGIYVSGEAFEKKSLRKTALLCLESWAITGIIVSGMKFATGRARPKIEEGASSHHPFSLSSRYHSFPSGHASSAFAVATTVAENSDEVYVDVLAFGLATLAALSRVHDNEHWFSDIFIGSTLGYFVAKKISGLNKRRDSQESKLELILCPGKKGIVVSLLIQIF